MSEIREECVGGPAGPRRPMGLEALSTAQGLNDIAKSRFSVFRSIDAPNLFLLAPGVLENQHLDAVGLYAHREVDHVPHRRAAGVRQPPRETLTTHFDLVKLLARADRTNYPFMLWYLKYLWLALRHPNAQLLPIP